MPCLWRFHIHPGTSKKPLGRKALRKPVTCLQSGRLGWGWGWGGGGEVRVGGEASAEDGAGRK